MSVCVLLSPLFLSAPKTKLHSSSYNHSCNSPGRWYKGEKPNSSKHAYQGKRTIRFHTWMGIPIAAEQRNLTVCFYHYYSIHCISLYHILYNHTQWQRGMLSFCSNLPREPLDLYQPLFGLYIITRAAYSNKRVSINSAWEKPPLPKGLPLPV